MLVTLTSSLSLVLTAWVGALVDAAPPAPAESRQSGSPSAHLAAARAGLLAGVTCRGKAATIVGTEGDDQLTGTNGRDVIAGLGGLDRIDARGGNDLICGGDNPAKFADGDLLYETIWGGGGNDVVLGERGYDEIDGGTGNDVVLGGDRDDFVTGGDGRDRVDGQGGDDQVNGDRGRDATYGGSGNDWVEPGTGGGPTHGGPGNDELTGTRYNDVLHGDGGADVLVGDRGDDRLYGGPGRDVAYYVNISCGSGCMGSHHIDVTVNLRTRSAGGGAFGHDRLSRIQGAWTGEGDDTFLGNAGNNVFYPSTGRATYRAGAGTDTFSFDTRIEGGCCEPVDIDLTTGRTTYSGATLRFTSVENVTGGSEADTIRGNNKANRVIGGSSYDAGDTLAGRGGNDVMRGAGGDDILTGGAGDDTLLGARGADQLDGGSGTNRNYGGRGRDSCINPDTGPLAIDCETTPTS